MKSKDKREIVYTNGKKQFLIIKAIQKIYFSGINLMESGATGINSY